MVAEEQQDSVAPENNEAATTVKFLFAGIVFVINGFFAEWILAVSYTHLTLPTKA